MHRLLAASRSHGGAAVTALKAGCGGSGSSWVAATRSVAAARGSLGSGFGFGRGGFVQPQAGFGVRALSWWGGSDDDGNDKKNKKQTAKADAEEQEATKKDDAAEEEAQRVQVKVTSDTEPGSDSEDKSSPPVEVVKDVTRIPQGDNAPRPPSVIALPVSRKPLFPGFMMPLTITDEPMIEALTSLKRSLKPYLGVFMAREIDDSPSGVSKEADSILPLTDLSTIHEMGTLAHLAHMVPLPGGIQVMLMAHRRISITGAVEHSNPLRANVIHLNPPELEAGEEDIAKAYSNEILTTLREVIKVNPMFKEHVQYFTQRLDVQDMHKLADFAAALTTATGSELQRVLEAPGIVERLKGALTLLKKELELSKLQQEISQQVEETMAKNQRNYFLQEQLKSIKKELGLEKDDKEALLTKFRERLEGVDLPEEAATVINDEMEKLASLEKNSSEFNVTRAYLDWLTVLPWNKWSEENFDISRAESILNEDHYGMKDVKDRILEFIAVGNLKGSVQGKILCMVGPPGVGKTSIGKSIARALNREFYRFSVGGLHDVAEIKGHRRTYIGAMPGKIIQCLKSVGVSNPLILIDEIDKLGRGGYQGDPASALLEVLDPNQNAAFLDHYLDVPVDISKVLFLVTANVTDTIPAPLLDRMEVIRLSGYDSTEKLEIAKRYLDPKAREETGLQADKDHTPKTLQLTDDAIDCLIRWYCRESGVRNLEQKITKTYQKAALKVVRDTKKEVEDWSITSDNIHEYVGKRVFTSDRMFDTTPPGVIMGLAWTAMGGSALYIEVTSPNYVHALEEEKRQKKAADEADGKSEDDDDCKPGAAAGFKITGQLGDVMQESAQISRTLARHVLRAIQPESDFFERASLHMHVPEGAVPKDGPSAGVTMVTALLSLALNKPVLADMAMTGEVSLTGKVLPVGGIKEKTMAAKRAGVTTLIFPADNRRDFEELPDYVREGLTVHFAKHYSDVIKVALGIDVSGSV